jgi:hypothetical protein
VSEQRTDFERELVRRLADAARAAAPGALERAKLAVASTPQRRAWHIGLTSAAGEVHWLQAAAAVAVVLAALVVGYALGRLSPRVGDGPSATPSPSLSAEVLPWTPDRALKDWPVPVRPEPSGEPILTTLEPGPSPIENAILDMPWSADPLGDLDGSAPGWLDITKVVVAFTIDPDGTVLFDEPYGVRVELATHAPSDFPDPRERWVAYGLVVDVDADGQPDLRLGMDNAPGGEHRAWWTDLATGATAAKTGSPHGSVGDIYFDTWLPGESFFGQALNFGTMLFDSEEVGAFNFYVWASLIEDGRVVATDYAPDAGWIDGAPRLSALHDEAWPRPTREEPLGRSVVVPWQLGGELRTFTDTIGESGLSVGIDLSTIKVHRMATTEDGRGVALYFNLVEGRPDPDPRDRIFAYGVVLDINADGIPDYRIGMDNTAGDRHREWISNLATGEAAINPGATYGWNAFGHWTDTYFPGQEDALDMGHLIATLGDPGTRFYVWASVIENGGTAVTDYAPDSGWLTHDPNPL